MTVSNSSFGFTREWYIFNRLCFHCLYLFY
ncbi:hypothetical protein V1477_008594 [Vespula maculifrons]|uniref:Uncharacterized protein n=1 Tax=Vespula maculifrons TaxID=7453 RepID=A0ABD2CDI8_VESMC